MHTPTIYTTQTSTWRLVGLHFGMTKLKSNGTKETYERTIEPTIKRTFVQSHAYLIMPNTKTDEHTHKIYRVVVQLKTRVDMIIHFCISNPLENIYMRNEIYYSCVIILVFAFLFSIFFFLLLHMACLRSNLPRSSFIHSIIHSNSFHFIQCILHCDAVCFIWNGGDGTVAVLLYDMFSQQLLFRFSIFAISLMFFSMRFTQFSSMLLLFSFLSFYLSFFGLDSSLLCRMCQLIFIYKNVKIFQCIHMLANIRILFHYL